MPKQIIKGEGRNAGLFSIREKKYELSHWEVLDYIDLLEKEWTRLTKLRSMSSPLIRQHIKEHIQKLTCLISHD